MTEQQIRESYLRLYSKVGLIQRHSKLKSDKKKYSELEQLRCEAERLGLKNWVPKGCTSWSAITRWPRSTSAWAVWLPRKPAAPVTSTGSSVVVLTPLLPTQD